MFCQHHQILLFKRFFGMMFHLVLDVFNNSILGEYTDCKGSKAILPAKLVNLSTGVIDVLTGIGFELSNKVRDGNLGRNTHQQMGMIKEPAHFDCVALKFMGCTSHVGKNIFTKAIGEPSLSVFGAENGVLKQLLMSAHDSVPKCEV